MGVTIKDLDVQEKIQWCPGCVLPDTLIHTNPDIIEIKDLEVGDKVLGFDGEYHRITEVMSHHHIGDMYKVTVKNFGTCDLTHEHPLYISRRVQKKRNNSEFPLEWVEAEHLKVGDYVAYPIPKQITDVEQVRMNYDVNDMDRKSTAIPESVAVGPEFMRLLGYYLAEGHVHKREVVLTFNIREREYVQDVESIISNLFGLKATTKERSEKNTIEIHASSSLLARAFRNLLGSDAANKKIPQFAMILPPEKQAELLKALWRGDGWISDVEASYKTISLALCNQIKLLLLRQGIIPSIHSEEPHGIHKKSYSLFVKEPDCFNRLMGIMGVASRKEGNPRSLIIKDSNYVYLPIKRIEKYQHDGTVFNLEVEDAESYVTQNATLHNCGNFGLITALKGALADLNLPRHETVLVSGIGCSSKLPHYVDTYGFEAIHGRPLPVASAVKLANASLNVIAVGGDGDGYGIGVQHFVHIMRRNYDLTYIVHNNQIYGLTTGQASPTSQKGMKTKTTPWGVIEEPFRPLVTAINGGATFVARGFAGDPAHLKGLIRQAIEHKGFSFIDVFQPCVTFNKLNTYPWFQERIYKLGDGHDKGDRWAALKKAYEGEETEYKKVPIGVFYKADKPRYEEQLPQLKDKPLAKQDIKDVDISMAYEELE
ncbi:hypothetical protein GF318_03625 [Candidatus Micrarchaeota archaeon]|nr:hypothetical protein [Candidatus Micrarchaeota archaeon]